MLYLLAVFGDINWLLFHSMSWDHRHDSSMHDGPARQLPAGLHTPLAVGPASHTWLQVKGLRMLTTSLLLSCYIIVVESSGHVIQYVWRVYSVCKEVLHHRVRRNSNVETAAPSSLSSASPPSAHSTTSIHSATSPQQRQWSQWCRRVRGASLNICKWLCNALPVF